MKTTKLAALLIALVIQTQTVSEAQEVPNNAPAGSEQTSPEMHAVIPTMHENLPCPFPMRIRRGEFETVRIGRWYMLDQIMVQLRGHADLEILANGVSRKFIRVKGRTSVIVDIKDRVNTLIFRHAGNGGRIKIRKIQILPCRIGFGYGCNRPIVNPFPCQGRKCPPVPGFPGHNDSSVGDVLYMMQDVLYSLTDLVSADDLAKYVSPIRGLVGRAISVASARGDLSQDTKDAVMRLLAKLDQSQSWMDSLKSTQATYEIGVELEYSKELLKNMIR